MKEVNSRREGNLLHGDDGGWGIVTMKDGRGEWLYLSDGGEVVVLRLWF